MESSLRTACNSSSSSVSGSYRATLSRPLPADQVHIAVRPNGQQVLTVLAVFDVQELLRRISSLQRCENGQASTIKLVCRNLNIKKKKKHGKNLPIFETFPSKAADVTPSSMIALAQFKDPLSMAQYLRSSQPPRHSTTARRGFCRFGRGKNHGERT